MCFWCCVQLMARRCFHWWQSSRALGAQMWQDTVDVSIDVFAWCAQDACILTRLLGLMAWWSLNCRSWSPQRMMSLTMSLLGDLRCQQWGPLRQSWWPLLNWMMPVVVVATQVVMCWHSLAVSNPDCTRMGHTVVGRCANCMLDLACCLVRPCRSCRWELCSSWQCDLFGHICSMLWCCPFLFVWEVMTRLCWGCLLVNLWMDFLDRWDHSLVLFLCCCSGRCCCIPFLCMLTFLSLCDGPSFLCLCLFLSMLLRCPLVLDLCRSWAVVHWVVAFGWMMLLLCSIWWWLFWYVDSL